MAQSAAFGIRRRAVPPTHRHRRRGDADDDAGVMSQYFYIDPQGREQGPFAFAHVAKWYKHGYLAPNLGCRRADEGTYRRTVTQALVEDAAANGVPAHAVSELVRPTSSARGGAVSGSSGLREVPPPPPVASSHPAGGRAMTDVNACMEKLLELLDRVLPIVLEGGLREEFGEVWSEMLHTPPPWTLETTLRELKANWGSLFATQPRRINEIECLLDMAIRQRKEARLAENEAQGKEASAAAVALLSACPKTFPPAVIERLRVAWEEAEQIRAFLHV